VQLVLEGEDQDGVEQAAEHLGLPSQKVFLSLDEEDKGEV
jgi:hypothetical protein